jgi:hypothetical protein
MRLAVAILWCIAAVIWLPWFALLVRLAVDVISGVPITYSEYLNPALVPVWPTYGWLHWSIVSWWPILALLAMALVYTGWRFLWWEQDWQRTHSTAAVALSVAVPPLAPIILYRDARRRFIQRNMNLQETVHSDVEALDDSDKLRLLS